MYLKAVRTVLRRGSHQGEALEVVDEDGEELDEALEFGCHSGPDDGAVDPVLSKSTLLEARNEIWKCKYNSKLDIMIYVQMIQVWSRWFHLFHQDLSAP